MQAGADGCGRRQVVVVNLSGRGDKDVESVLAWEPPGAPRGGVGEAGA